MRALSQELPLVRYNEEESVIVGYTMIRRLSIDSNIMEMSLCTKEVKLRTDNEGLSETDLVYKAKTIEELRDLVLGITNGLLNCTYKISRSHALSQRIGYLKDIGQIRPLDGHGSLSEVIDNEENRKILTGETKVKIKKYTVSSEKLNLAIKMNKKTFALVKTSDPHTTYYSREDADDMLKAASKHGWDKSYDLKVIEK